jgi:hypothetical protein
MGRKAIPSPARAIYRVVQLADGTYAVQVIKPGRPPRLACFKSRYEARIWIRVQTAERKATRPVATKQHKRARDPLA